MRYSSLMHAYLLVKITPVPVKLLCDLSLIIIRAQNCFILFPSLHVPAPHKEASTESKAVPVKLLCDLCLIIIRAQNCFYFPRFMFQLLTKKQAQSRKQTTAGVKEAEF
jgi:hypothetical protein